MLNDAHPDGTSDSVPGSMSHDTGGVERRKKWEHEDHLINHRITWLLGSQTLLLGAYGLLNQRLTDWFFCPTANQRNHLIFLLSELPSVGFWLSLALGLGLVAALIAMLVLKRDDKKHGERSDVRWYTTVGGWIAGIALPIIFCVAWMRIGHHQSRSPLGNLPSADDMSCYPFRLEQWKLAHPPPPTTPLAAPVAPFESPQPATAPKPRRSQEDLDGHSKSRRVGGASTVVGAKLPRRSE